MGLGAMHPEPIPFAYKEAYPIFLSDECAFDYGIIAISPHYRRLLQANKVQALNEEVWKKQPTKVDFYVLLGIPTELVRLNSENVEMSTVLHMVEPIDQKPDGFSEVEAPLFYGRIVLGDRLKSIDGESGGPVFAFHEDPKGQLRYWLTALQSRWLPQSHFIAACPTTLLGHLIEDAIVKAAQKPT